MNFTSFPKDPKMETLANTPSFPRSDEPAPALEAPTTGGVRN